MQIAVEGALRLCCCLTHLFAPAISALLKMERSNPPLPLIEVLRASTTSISREHKRSSRGWQKQHPEDPVGPVSEAAGLLFSEFNRLGVLEAQFYENDAAFENARN